jgi:two-component system chemotaxis sensor kinase CheA
MSDAAQLVELIIDSAPYFAEAGADREPLKKTLGGLHAFIAVSETGYPAEVTDAIWQGARQLKKAIDSPDEISTDTLNTIYEQLISAIDFLEDDPAETTPEAPQTAEAPPTEEIPDAPPSEEAPAECAIPESDFALIKDFVSEAEEHLEAAEAAMLELETHVEDKDTLNRIFRGFHTIKGMAGFLNLEQIGALSHEAETLLDLARKGDVLLCGANADAVFHAIDMLKSMVRGLYDVIEGDGIVPHQSGMQELIEQIRIQCNQQDQSGSTPAPAKPMPATPAPQDKPEKSSTENTANPKNSNQIEEKIKVSTERLDSLVNMVGELVIAQLMVTESLKTSTAGTSADLLRNTTHQSKIIRELQELSMSMRMVPINGVFQRTVRIVRDLSRQTGKEINLSMIGEQTELDRTIVDKLADPLIHMIRNSVDHGVESPEERIAAGKPRAGLIELRACHLAGNVVIEIKDDGHGIDRDKILSKAQERGIVSSERTLTDSEVFSLIFHPGFSTAETITSVSGRGVGMDVVKRNIEALSGRIDIASTLGKGTTFTLTLPLTLAIIDGQVVEVGKERYIIPISSIVKSFRPTAEQVSTVQGKREVVMERDQLLPLVRLHELFNIEAKAHDPTQGLVMIVEEDNQACCLLVDDLLDQQQVVIKSLSGSLQSTIGISGGAILGDGLVRLILDIPGIIKLYKE